MPTWLKLVLPHSRGSGDASRRREFGIVALAVIQAERVAVVTLLAGNGQRGGGVETTGKEDDGIRHGMRLTMIDGGSLG